MRELERDLTEISAPRALPPITLIGRGRVGGALRRAATEAGLAVELCSLADFCAGGGVAPVTLLCVPDDAIGEAAERVREVRTDVKRLGHVSGSHTLEVLGPASADLERLSLHPLQTVPDAEASLAGDAAAIAADSPATLELARDLAVALGMSPFELSDTARAAYHAAASIASNFMVALQESAIELLAEAEIANGRQLLAPLVERTASNWAERGAAALTGPIARGDERTLNRHREAVAELAPQLGELYEALAARTATVAGAGSAARGREGVGA